MLLSKACNFLLLGLAATPVSAGSGTCVVPRGIGGYGMNTMSKEDVDNLPEANGAIQDALDQGHSDLANGMTQEDVEDLPEVNGAIQDALDQGHSDLANGMTQEDVEDLPEVNGAIQDALDRGHSDLANGMTQEDVEDLPEVNGAIQDALDRGHSDLANGMTQEDVEDLPEVNGAIQDALDRGHSDLANGMTQEDVEDLPEVNDAIQDALDRGHSDLANGRTGTTTTTTTMEQNEVDSLPGMNDAIQFALNRGHSDLANRQSGIETAIELRITAVSRVAWYNMGAAFHPTALDFFGRKDVSEQRRRCPDTPQDLLKAHQHVTALYTWAWSIGTIEYEITLRERDELVAIMDSWGLDLNRCPPKSKENGCDDISTPWGLARVLADEALDFAARDGWNADGSLSHTHNKKPYEDWRKDPYKPVNAPWSITDLRRWQPLKEHNHVGFFYYQEHVVPHAGETGKSFFLGDEDLCSRSSPAPEYDLEQEALDAVQRTSELDSLTKAKIEYFDQKIPSIIGCTHEYLRMTKQGLATWEGIATSSVVAVAIYEATLAVSREKTRHDLVRPTTVVRELYGDREFDTYAGHEIGGNAKILGKDWEPYNPIMPHSEYPSGSACMCSAFASAMVTWTGSDELVKTAGAPIMAMIRSLSSKYEFNQPPTNVTLPFETWSQFAKECGQSRIDGGMHFPAAIKAGHELCSDIGEKVANSFKQLEKGERPDFVVDVDSPIPSEKRCSSKEEPDPKKMTAATQTTTQTASNAVSGGASNDSVAVASLLMVVPLASAAAVLFALF